MKLVPYSSVSSNYLKSLEAPDRTASASCDWLLVYLICNEFEGVITFRIHLYELFQVEFQSENDQIMQGLLLLFDMLSRWRQEWGERESRG